jgi:arylsulfatase A-like enzyme
MNSIVISLGGLRIHFLGCYGGAWIETPAIDRFAAEGFVFDECFAESPSPDVTRRNWWTGCYQNFRACDQPVAGDGRKPSLLHALRSAGIRTTLIRDTRLLVENGQDESVEFDQVIEVDRGDNDSTAHVFEEARRWIKREANRVRFLLFIDCHGAHPPWSPPDGADDAEDSVDEIDVELEPDDGTNDGGAIGGSAVHETSENDDASELSRQAYAAVVTHLDSQLGSFIEFLRTHSEWEQTLVAITSDCGASFDDRDAATLGSSDLHDGRTHLPLLVRVPGAHDPGTRSAALVQSIDLLPTVCDASGVSVSADVHGRSLLPIIRLHVRSVRDEVLMTDAVGGWLIRTSAWRFILPSSVGSEAVSAPQLYVMPNDRWDRNDLAKQYPEVVEVLAQRLRSRMGGR